MFLKPSYYEDYTEDSAYVRADEHHEVKNILSDAQAALQIVVDQLYGFEILDIARLEDRLDELCYLLNVVFPGDRGLVLKEKRSSSELFEFAANLSLQAAI